MTRLVLPIATALLAAVLAAEILTGPAAPDLSADTPRAAAPGSPPGAVADGRVAEVGGWARTVLARPVFVPGRRPPAPPARAEAAAAFVLPRLAGVMVGPTDRVAIFAATPGGKPLVMREGGRMGDDMIDSIEPGQVTLSGPDGARILLPHFDAGPHAAATATAIPPTLTDPAARAALARVLDAAR